MMYLSVLLGLPIIVNALSVDISIRDEDSQNPLLLKEEALDAYDCKDSQTPIVPEANAVQCDCSGTRQDPAHAKDYICGDPRLGPIKLPKKYPFLSIVSDYDRFGGLSPSKFLRKFWNATDSKKPTWCNSPYHGYLDDGCQAIKGTVNLQRGTLVDRFGNESGKYLAAADAPYIQRSLPPSSLDGPEDGPAPHEYHVYLVNISFPVEGGPVRPFYGQPGLGYQFYVANSIPNHPKTDISYLVSQKYLVEQDLNRVKPGPGQGADCEVETCHLVSNCTDRLHSSLFD